MIDGIRNWLGDIASGGIKDQRIALSAEQAAAYKAQLDDLALRLEESDSKNESLSREFEQAKSKIENLESKLAISKKEPSQLSENAEVVLKLFYDNPREITKSEVVQHTGFSDADVDFIFNSLYDLDYISIVRPAVISPLTGIRSPSARGMQRSPSRRSEAAYKITYEGQQHVNRR